MTDDEGTVTVATMPGKLITFVKSDHADVVLCDATFCYVSADPLSVHLLLSTSADDTVVRVLSRDLLRAGLNDRAGDGKVVIWPNRAIDDTLTVCVGLRGRRLSVLTLPRDALVAFLDDSTRIVAIGAETPHVDIDGTLAALRRESP
jgi:Streptomyces sporulation and cell division protein, SsgA